MTIQMLKQIADQVSNTKTSEERLKLKIDMMTALAGLNTSDIDALTATAATLDPVWRWAALKVSATATHLKKMKLNIELNEIENKRHKCQMELDELYRNIEMERQRETQEAELDATDKRIQSAESRERTSGPRPRSRP